MARRITDTATSGALRALVPPGFIEATVDPRAYLPRELADRLLLGGGVAWLNNLELLRVANPVLFLGM
jgi:hypothetical protein